MASAPAKWPARPIWAPPGERDEAELRRILEFRAERAIRHFGALARDGTERHCPICDYRGPFSPVRHKPEIWCPQCDSRPRHRLMKLWMDRHLVLPRGARVLHFAPEPWVRGWLEARGARYTSADISGAFDLTLDITAMDLPDMSVDLLIANHVLEHVDDAVALAEIHRILLPGGIALLTVPMIEGWDETYEDRTLDQTARWLRYGDPTHLRFYGRDVRDRITRAGFHLSEAVAREPDVSTHALNRGERLFLATKQ